MLVQPLEQVVHPRGNRRAAHGREPADRGEVGHRHDPGHDLGVDPGRRRLVAEAEEGFGGEEELGDRAVGAGVELALEVVEVGGRARRFGMAFGIGGDRDLERRDASALRPARRHWHSLADAAELRARPADRRAARRCGARPRPNRRGRSRRPRRGSPRRRSGARPAECRSRGRSARRSRGSARGSSRPRRRSPNEARASGASVSIDCHSVSSIFSVLGGKNSKDTAMSPGARRTAALRGSERCRRCSCRPPLSSALGALRRAR